MKMNYLILILINKKPEAKYISYSWNFKGSPLIKEYNGFHFGRKKFCNYSWDVSHSHKWHSPFLESIFLRSGSIASKIQGRREVTKLRFDSRIKLTQNFRQFFPFQLEGIFMKSSSNVFEVEWNNFQLK